MELIQFDICTTNKNKSMQLTKKQIVVLLEALWDFKESVQSIDSEGDLRKRLLEHKQSEVDNLFDYLQDSINYDFGKHLQKCFKKSKEDDPGMETMQWLSNSKKE